MPPQAVFPPPETFVALYKTHGRKACVRSYVDDAGCLCPLGMLTADAIARRLNCSFDKAVAEMCLVGEDESYDRVAAAALDIEDDDAIERFICTYDDPVDRCDDNEEGAAVRRALEAEGLVVPPAILEGLPNPDFHPEPRPHDPF